MSDKISCYNCNGLGEKTRSRSSHSSVHRTTKCYTCIDSGELELSVESLKNSVIYYLKLRGAHKRFFDITDIWNEVESWCKIKHYIVNGLYARGGERINLAIKVSSQEFHFMIELSELN